MLFILCLCGFFFFNFFFNFFFFFVNTRYFSNQRKKCYDERTEQMWSAAGWAFCCSHLWAATTLTHSRASILRLAAAHPWQGWGRGGAGVGGGRWVREQAALFSSPLPPLACLSKPLTPGQQTRSAHINVTALATAPSLTPSVPPCPVPAARPPCLAGLQPSPF